MALEHAKEVAGDEHSRSLSMWMKCLELGLKAVEERKPLVFDPPELSAHKPVKWSKNYFNRFSEWHESDVAPHLLRRARRRGLLPLGLKYLGVAEHRPRPKLQIVKLMPAKAQRAGVPAQPSVVANAEETGAGFDAEEVESAPGVVDTGNRAQEDTFVARFGFDAPPMVRAQVLRLKRDYEFTDREIRWLRRSGALPTRGDRIVCKPSPLMVGVGALLLTVLCVWMVHALTAFYLDPSRTLAGALAGIGVLLCLLGIAWLIGHTYISPFFFLRRRLRRASDSAASSHHSSGVPHARVAEDD